MRLGWSSVWAVGLQLRGAPDDGHSSAQNMLSL